MPTFALELVNPIEIGREVEEGSVIWCAPQYKLNIGSLRGRQEISTLNNVRNLNKQKENYSKKELRKEEKEGYLYVI